MKINKFGKLQKQILASVNQLPEIGCPIRVLYEQVFPRGVYPFSYLIPVLLRMEHQKLIRVAWNRVDPKLSQVYVSKSYRGKAGLRKQNEI